MRTSPSPMVWKRLLAPEPRPSSRREGRSGMKKCLPLPTGWALPWCSPGYGTFVTSCRMLLHPVHGKLRTMLGYGSNRGLACDLVAFGSIQEIASEELFRCRNVHTIYA